MFSFMLLKFFATKPFSLFIIRKIGTKMAKYRHVGVLVLTFWLMLTNGKTIFEEFEENMNHEIQRRASGK